MYALLAAMYSFAYDYDGYLSSLSVFSMTLIVMA